MFEVNKNLNSKSTNLNEYSSSIFEDFYEEGSEEAAAISKRRVSAMIERRTVKERQKNMLISGLDSAIPVDNIGYALIKKMGYQEGNPLGKMGVGLIEPLKVSLEFQNRKGLADNHEKQQQKNKKKKQAAAYGAFISGGYNTEQVLLKNEPDFTPDYPRKIIRFNNSYKLSNTTPRDKKFIRRKLRHRSSKKTLFSQKRLFDRQKPVEEDNNSEFFDQETSFKKIKITLSNDVKLLKAKLNAYLAGGKIEPIKRVERYVERNAKNILEYIGHRSLFFPKSLCGTSSPMKICSENSNLEKFSTNPSPNLESSNSISHKVGNLTDVKASLSKKLKSLKCKLNSHVRYDMNTGIQREALGNSCQVIIESDPQLKSEEMAFVMEILTQKALEDNASGPLQFFRHEPQDSNKFVIISGNNSSLKWLQSEIAIISKTWFGPTLKVLIIDNVNRIWKISLKIEAVLGKQQILNILKSQFPGLHTNQWFFEKFEISQSSKTYVEAIIDENSMLLLNTLKIRQLYDLKRIKLEII